MTQNVNKNIIDENEMMSGRNPDTQIKKKRNNEYFLKNEIPFYNYLFIFERDYWIIKVKIIKIHSSAFSMFIIIKFKATKIKRWKGVKKVIFM